MKEMMNKPYKTPLPATMDLRKLLQDNATRTSYLETMDGSLEVLQGPHRGERLPLKRDILHIGRAQWCDLMLEKDPGVSARHCELTLDPHGLRVRDVGSRNGTFLEGQRIFDAYISPGASLRIGASVLQLRANKERQKLTLRHQDASGQIVGKSPEMRKIFSMLERLGPREIPVLLTGETGTGKTSIARALHQQSNRSKGPFVAVNCGAIAESLAESELFGYEKGAFTGALHAHPGFFEQANGGTLFFDEIGELSANLQIKLLDVLESQQVRRLGGQRVHQVDVRLIFATHRNLQKEVREGNFRHDLYHRIAVINLNIPPLRERPEDLPLLAELFLQQLQQNKREPLRHLSPDAIEKLQRYLWPGNIRELHNILTHTHTMTDSPLLSASSIVLPETENSPPPPYTPTHTAQTSQTHPHIPPFRAPQTPLQQDVEALLADFDLETPPCSLRDLRSQFECIVVKHALKTHRGNMQKTAKTLQVAKGWFYELVNRWGLREEEA